ncbi:MULTISPECIES: cytochrome c-type biogenesis protein [Ralstonia]|jgi:cytochrome c-type biogenesis protein CcmH|uniref:Cytochrome c-type biogenesis protein n=2 Tax=Ralstonia pickettii TaxID=329 RepID=A0ABN9HZI9_RALPI|nr:MULTISPECIES: cytochrome c-type biogenesis protein [Ralstonia]MBA4015331.1 cytochrome c-type biogenesis protein CcmH [Ralstonia sp.]MBA4201780.1 cytochrome c-type biogenesis protein CcmH [Ralstonia sp.]MBA4229695.1 cytochrome c-type biogenesis protein CcmH [Ralstonia sp.]MBA4236359.1 cytochrome c-type biogenesis protein CcmH [Ralstonia sp.]MBA4401452.1 cytochrome c-type biogenesis protein CcmH [Ralstonia sp.]
MHKRLAALLLAGVAAFTLQMPARATASDVDLDTRVHALSEQLRCLVCQNQTLADSNADLAVDLRRQIREQLRAGATEADVKDYLVQRYGDFVLYRPPVKPLTYLLWFGPALLLMAVVFGIVSSRKHQKATAAEMDPDAQALLTALLASSQPDDSRR